MKRRNWICRPLYLLGACAVSTLWLQITGPSFSINPYNSGDSILVIKGENETVNSETARSSFKESMTTQQGHERFNASSSPFNHSQSTLFHLLPPDYQVRVSSSVQQAIQPIWFCNKTGTDSSTNTVKLAFVHVFKTAGSTIRQFFLDYAETCLGHSYATLIRCTNVTLSTLLDSSPSSSWLPCRLKNHRDRQGEYKSFNDNDSVQSAKLKWKYDILGGHFRLGVLDYLQKRNDTTILPSPDTRSIAFFRNAAAKYVSGKLFVETRHRRKNWNVTLQAMINQITDEVEDASREGRYDSKYAMYLLTPTQQHEASLEQWGRQYQVQVMAQNLIDYNVTIGIVENMTQSIQLLQNLLDATGHATSLFQAYSTTTTSESSKRRNVSPISTGAILNHLQQEQPEIYQKLLKFVSYEQQVTDFAVALHERQYQALEIVKEKA